MKSLRLSGLLLSACLWGAVSSAHAAVPAGYYNNCENKGGNALLQAVFQTIGSHTVVSYSDLWSLYKYTDTKANGKIWDMYSTKEWNYGKEQCGNYSNVGDCYNREHSMPKSWFNDASPMVSDAFHIYPTDGKVNGQRSDFPYGECAGGTTLKSNGGVSALGRLGSSTFSGYRGTVFEPDDEYKGDFARSYFYMAAAYNDRISGWSSDMLAGNSYPAFSSWAVELLLKWHRQDPVSDKEIARNDAVYAHQKNRNPFIDNPEMVEYIWGNKKTEVWTSASGAQPTLLLPVDGSTIELGTVAVGVSRTYTVSVKGNSLKNNVTVALSGNTDIFSISPATLSAASLNSADGQSVTVTVKASKSGTFTTTLRLSSADKIDTKVTLSVSAMTGLPATAPTNITDESFIAHWTYIGDADSHGCYSIYVLDADGNNVDTYPRSVIATDEAYLVDELEPETDYMFYIRNNILESNRMSVRTAAPIPEVQILYDGELYLLSEPGVPSEPAELLLDIENIVTDITFTVSEPFELSDNRNDWSTSLTLDPRQDRMYIRINGNQEGTYTSSIRVKAGEYVNDNAEVSGKVAASVYFEEYFEQPSSLSGYTGGEYDGDACRWTFTDANVYSGDITKNNQNLRFGKTKTSSAQTEDLTDGLGTVNLDACGWSDSDGAATFKLQYSSDKGATWQDAGEAHIDATRTLKNYTFTVNCTGTVRMRILQTSGARLCIDNIKATRYMADNSVEGLFGDDRGTGWDAYCIDGNLVISLSESAPVAVHGVDGVTYVNSTAAAGDNTYNLQPGLYVVVVGQSTRRVLVR